MAPSTSYLDSGMPYRNTRSEDLGDIEVLINMLPVLACWSRKLPYTIDQVDSNDVLFGGNKMFLDECAQQFNDILSEVLRGLQPTPDDAPKIKKRRAEIMVQLINVLVSITDFSANKSSLIVMKKLLKEVNEYYGNSE